MAHGLEQEKGRCCRPPCVFELTMEGHDVQANSNGLDGRDYRNYAGPHARPGARRGEVEAGVQLRVRADSPRARHRLTEHEDPAGPDRVGEEEARTPCPGARGELLRSGSRGFLASPLSDGPRRREPGRGLLEHRSAPEAPASEDGSPGPRWTLRLARSSRSG